MALTSFEEVREEGGEYGGGISEEEEEDIGVLR